MYIIIGLLHLVKLSSSCMTTKQTSAAMMHGAASTPPETSKSRHVPPEILTQILQNLPVKSLLRFSIVSKSWNSMIWEPSFVQEHQSQNSREKFVIIPSLLDHLSAASVCRISPASSAVEDSTALFCPFEGTPRLRATCGALWLVDAKDSLFLWNHSTRSFWKLPRTEYDYGITRFVYGVAYDAAADDYKILKISRKKGYDSGLYSLKSDYWKYFNPRCNGSKIKQKKLEFVNGAFHWISKLINTELTLVAFDLSTGTQREVGLPAIDYEDIDSTVVAVVLKGKLCVCLSYYKVVLESSFILWEMEEYGVEESWTKKFDIDFSCKLYRTMIPLYFYDNGDIVFNLSSSRRNKGLFIYRKEGNRVDKIYVGDGDDRIHVLGGFVYLESLVSLPHPSPITPS